MKKLVRIGDVSWGKRAELCNISYDIPCPKTCRFLTEQSKCKLVEMKYKDEMIEIDDDEEDVKGDVER